MRKSIYAFMGATLIFWAINVYACGDGSACVKKTDVKKNSSIKKTGKEMAAVQINSKNMMKNAQPAKTFGQEDNSIRKNSISPQPSAGKTKQTNKRNDSIDTPNIFTLRGVEFQAETANSNPWSWKALGDFIEE